MLSRGMTGHAYVLHIWMWHKTYAYVALHMQMQTFKKMNYLLIKWTKFFCENK
jgi:hypothetical protein